MSDLSPSETAGVQWWAHRGTLANENTWVGIKAALDAGAHGVEVDLQVSRDGEVFLFHDDELERVGDLEARARAMSWDELAQLKVCGGEAIMRLDELLERWPAEATLNLELKAGGESLIGAVETLLCERAGLPRILVSSFDPAMLRSAARLGHERALLLETPSAQWLHDEGAIKLGVGAVIVEACLATDVFLDREFGRGLKVGIWGGASLQEERGLVAKGVKTVISDHLVPAGPPVQD